MFLSDQSPHGFFVDDIGSDGLGLTGSERRATIGFLFGAGLYLYLIFFVLPHTPIYRGGDGDLYLASATRLFSGEVMYRDFNQFTFPGTEVLYTVLFNLFGPVPWVGNVALVGVGFGLTWLTLAISRKLLRGWVAFIPALFFLALVFPSMLDGTHHWYSVFGAMAAVAVVTERRTPGRLAAAGALCGLSAWFTHMRGFQAAVGIVVFLLWERQYRSLERRWLLKALACLAAAFLVSLVILNAYFVWKVGLGRFIQSTIIFGIKYYRSEPDNSWGMYLAEFPRLVPWPGLISFLTNLFVHLLVPYVYFVVQIRYWRTKPTHPLQPWDRVMLLQAVGLCLFVGVAPAAEWQRLATAALPATILLVWLLNSWGGAGRGMLATFAVTALAFVIAFSARMQTRHWTYLDIPAGRLAVAETPRLEILKWVLAHTKPGDFFFDNAGVHAFVILARVRCPGPVLFLTLTDYTRPEQVTRLIEALDRHRVRYILWETDFETSSASGKEDSHLEPLREYLHAHYRVVATLTGLNQVWERSDPAAP